MNNSNVTGADPGPTSAHQERIDAYFNTAASYWRDLYEDHTLFGVIHQERQSMALRWIDDLALASASSILEVGCGTGLLAIELARRGFILDCIDTSEAMVELARVHAVQAGMSDRLTVSIGDTHDLHFAASSHDLAIALGVIPFLHSPTAALAEIARVVKPGGHILFSSDNRFRINHVLDPRFTPVFAPLKEPAKRIVRRVSSGYREREVPLHRYSFAALERIVTDAGLVIVRSTVLGFGPFSFLGRDLLPEKTGIRVHRQLQSLADRGVPVLRSVGSQHIVLARRPSHDHHGQPSH